MTEDEKDDYNGLDDMLERAHKAELAATDADREETKKLFMRHTTFRITTPRVGVNPIMRRQLSGTTLGKGAFGGVGDWMDHFNGQLAGLVPPDPEAVAETTANTPEKRSEPEIVDPKLMEWSPTAEDLAWMDRASKKADAVTATVVTPVTTVPELPWLPSGPAKILAVLRRAANSKGRVSVSTSALVRETGLNRRHVQRMLDRLVESTLLEVVRPGYGFKKNGEYRYSAGQYQLAQTPDIFKAKTVLIRLPGRKKK
jgi:hypothetical protein